MVNLSNYATVVSDSWVSCSKPNPRSRVRLFCFPYAGAGSSPFNAWSNWLMPEVELYLVNLPGRDARIRETPCRHLQSLVKPLTQGLIPHLDKPFVFFGHSMGSLISFEVARELRRLAGPQPSHLFVSGRQPPHMPALHSNLHLLPVEKFLMTTQQVYGALPEIILQDRELLTLFLSIMQADITMIETYQYEMAAPLACPITVYGGVHDHSVSEEGLTAWQEQTTAVFKQKMFPGGHFFIQTARSAVLRELNEELSELIKGVGQNGDG